MGAELPEIGLSEFTRRLEACSPRPLTEEASRRLFLHYQELRRWNPRLSLVGPGTREEIVERHYGEALAALPLLPAGGGRLADLGSGAGFPGWVLAAVRPELEVTLVEARERKWAFLRSATRKASLSCRCLGARVGRSFPRGFPEEVDLMTWRALKIPAETVGRLAGRLAPAGRLLLWLGEADPDLPPGWVAESSLGLPGTAHRRIVSYRPK